MKRSGVAPGYALPTSIVSLKARWQLNFPFWASNSCYGSGFYGDFRTPKFFFPKTGQVM